jgi:putative N-acetylmannosamine-6-phosphate epimerase
VPSIDLIVEKYLGTVREQWKRENPDTDVFINPTRKELKEILHRRDDFAAIIPNDKDFIAFKGDTLHQSVREQLKLKKDIITVRCYMWNTDIDIQVTDNTKNTKWHHNPDIKDAIEDNKYINKTFTNVEISYYDEAIVGDWSELDE